MEITKSETAIASMARRLQVSEDRLQSTLKATAFSACKTNEEFVACVLVANRYGLDPILKEIYAFPGKGGGVSPMVSVDGWIRIINEHPAMDGMEFTYGAEDGDLWTECTIWRKDREKPVTVREWLSECQRNTEPWKTSPRRMLRHRALIQCARVAFGFSGIYSDPDEVDEVTETEAPPAAGTATVGDPLGLGKPEPKEEPPAPSLDPEPEPEAGELEQESLI